jgi:hypothetical protein
VLYAGSTLLLASTPRHQKLLLVPLPKSASNNLRKWFLSPTGRLNLGIITEGRFTDVLIIPSFWGFPTDPVRHHQAARRSRSKLWRWCWKLHGGGARSSPAVVNAVPRRPGSKLRAQRPSPVGHGGSLLARSSLDGCGGSLLARTT